MKNLSNKQLILIKKCVAVSCAVLCIIFMLFNIFTFTSRTTLSNGEDFISVSRGFSMFGFLFGNESASLGMNFSIVRDFFGFSYVMVWISFVSQIISLGILIYGVFSKKSLFSKIGSVSLLVSYAILISISFDTYSLGRTVKYLSIFNLYYLVELLLCLCSVFSTFTIKEK